MRGAARNETNIGRFLGRISKAVAGRVDEVRLSEGLPRVVFVVTSVSEVVGEANRLRRAGSYLLKAHELISYSPRSAAGKYWSARARAPEHNLGYVIALFRATLTTMTPSSVVYACAEYGDEDLKSYVKEHGIARSLSNANRTFQNTDFHRLLIGNPSRELTSTMKGQNSAFHPRSARPHPGGIRQAPQGDQPGHLPARGIRSPRVQGVARQLRG